MLNVGSYQRQDTHSREPTLFLLPVFPWPVLYTASSKTRLKEVQLGTAPLQTLQ